LPIVLFLSPLFASGTGTLDNLKKLIKSGKSLKGLNIEIKTKKPVKGDKPGSFMPSMGAGDIFMLLTYVAELKKRGANVVYSVPGYLKTVINSYTGFNVSPEQDVQYKTIELSTLYDVLGGKPFKTTKVKFTVDPQRLKKWDAYLDKVCGDEMPVAFFYGCAKNHRPERALTPQVGQLVSGLKGIKFIDLEYKSKFSHPDVAKPAAVDPQFDKKSFMDTAALLYAIFSRGGKVIAPDSGPLHLSSQIAEQMCKECVYACLLENPNERWRKTRYKGNSKTKCIWYPMAVRLFRKDSYQAAGKGRWTVLVKEIRKNLKEEAKKYKQKRALKKKKVVTEKKNKPKKLKDILKESK